MIRYQTYSPQEPRVFIWIILPYIALLNMILFGSSLFSEPAHFGVSLLVSGVYLFIAYFIFGQVAVLIRRQYPDASDLFNRIRYMLPAFYFMNFLLVQGLYLLYQTWVPIPEQPRESAFWWVVLFACLMSTLITFINEVLANLESWKRSIAETDRMNNLRQRSRILGLQGQVHPHFLFNCFNHLSGLIQEDANRAERFLDEMTRVHRYLLRPGDESLVSLQEELSFAGSYLYLLKDRYGQAFQYQIAEGDRSLVLQLPPLSLQVILEEITRTSKMGRSLPFHISLQPDADSLCIRYTGQQKNNGITEAPAEALTNLQEQYRMLNAGNILQEREGEDFVIRLPLINNPVQS